VAHIQVHDVGVLAQVMVRADAKPAAEVGAFLAPGIAVARLHVEIVCAANVGGNIYFPWQTTHFARADQVRYLRGLFTIF
jgi:hypothetical protein